jgi:hypothetical protein
MKMFCPAESDLRRMLLAGKLQRQTSFAMGKRAPTSLTSAPAVQRLTEELQTQASPKIILQGLKALSKGLSDEQTGCNVALWFLRAGGLPTLIRHLRACPSPGTTTESGVTPSALSGAAASALVELLPARDALTAELEAATDVTMPLIDALRDAPTVQSRTLAFNVLVVVAMCQPGQCRAIGEAGVVGLLATLYLESGDLLSDSGEFATLASNMVHMLLESGVAAATDLRQAILAPETDRVFTALNLLLVRQPCFCGFRPVASL